MPGEIPPELANAIASLDARLRAIEWRLGIRTTDAAETEPPAAPPMVPEAETAAPPQSSPSEAAIPANATGASRSAPARPALENIIGAHWLNRIGIAALIAAAAFFLKYAIDNEWIGPAMRVGIGIAAGVAMLVWSERFQARRLELFAHTLRVIAVGVLYLSIWAGSQVYALVGNGAAFGGMALVTAAVVALAIQHRSEFLAGVALTCGFLTPVLLATGANREVALFSYAALLDAAALLLVVLFPWLRALAVAFCGTLFLYVAWAADYYTPAQLTTTAGFATLFMLLFASVPLLRRWDEPALPGVLILLLPFANATTYFLQLAAMFRDAQRLAGYAAGLAAFFAAIAFALRLRGDEREDLRLVHVAIAIGFVTLVLPLRFSQGAVTIGWIAEAAALVALAPRMSPGAQKLLRALGAAAVALALFRMLAVDHYEPARLLFNMRMLTWTAAAGVIGAIAVDASRRGSTALSRFATVIANALLLSALTMEVSDYFNHFGGTAIANHEIARDFGWSALWMLYGAVLMTLGFRRHAPVLRWIALALIAITVGKVFFYDLSTLERIYRVLSFFALGVLLLGVSFVYQKRWIAE